MTQTTIVTSPWSTTALQRPFEGLLVVWVPKDTTARAIEVGIQKLKEQFRDHVEAGTMSILLATEDFRLEALNEQQMAEMGWQRIPPTLPS